MEGDCHSRVCMVLFIISIHSLRMEGDKSIYGNGLTEPISIHSLRMEGDIQLVCLLIRSTFISIHSLRMEGDI